MHNLTAQVFNIFLMNVHTGLNFKKKCTIVITETSFDKQKKKKTRMELLYSFLYHRQCRRVCESTGVGSLYILQFY